MVGWVRREGGKVRGMEGEGGGRGRRGGEEEREDLQLPLLKSPLWNRRIYRLMKR